MCGSVYINWYAPITGMCDPSRSCAVVTDEGFTSGFIVAHEIAHVFGVVHDGPENGCWGPAYSSAIMTPLVEAKLNRFRWSECSRARMQEVINYLFCLDDNPDIDSELDDHYALDTGHLLPGDLGRHWTLNFQCRLEFGYRSRLCSVFRDNACSVLWCSDSSSPYLCRTKRGPPMPGSNCGYAKECRDRQCVYVGREKAVEGGWTSWGEWGDCSVHCGVGIKRRRRFCSDPRPAYGGRPCPGEAESWDTCRTTKDCREHYDLRAVQCTVWDQLVIRQGQHAWKPYPARAERERCYQTCVSSITGEVVTLRSPVADGTPCDYNTSHICLHGKCLAVGCDGVQISNNTFDSCGVCGGNHSLCQTVSGHFTRQPTTEDEYEPVVFLPKGSRHVEVINRGKVGHFIALREPEDDGYVLNGNGKREESRKFVVGGALFEYERKFGYQAVRSPGPLYVNLEVMLYPAHDLSNASIRYQYSVSKKDTTLQRHRYRWRHKDWSPCSVSCGEGVKTGVQVCYDRDTGEERTEDTCHYLDPPAAQTAPCLHDPCSQKRHVWTVAPEEWGACNATDCGQQGQQQQDYGCQVHFPHNHSYVSVHPALCDPASRPLVTRTCLAPPCQLTWTTGEWSECSVTCGQGRQRRSVHCGDPLTDSDDIWCQDMPPALSRDCDTGPCTDVPQECRDILSMCSLAHSVDHKCHSRKFQALCCHSCRRQQSASAARTPRLSQRAIHRWVLVEDSWGRCSAERCGEEGEERQEYRCQAFFPHNRTSPPLTAHPHHCGPPLSAPRVNRKCHAPPCGMAWTLGPWSQCSVTCGQGRQRRSVHCGDPLTDSDDIWCQDMPPALSRDCDTGPCTGVTMKKGACLNKYSFCRRALGLSLKCLSKGFRRICCKTCRRFQRTAHRRQARRSHGARHKMSSNKSNPSRRIASKWTARRGNESVRRMRMGRLHRRRKHGSKKSKRLVKKPAAAIPRASPKRAGAKKSVKRKADKIHRPTARKRPAVMKTAAEDTVAAAGLGINASEGIAGRKTESKLAARMRAVNERYARRRSARARTADKHSANGQSAVNISEAGSSSKLPAADAPSEWDLYRQQLHRRRY